MTSHKQPATTKQLAKMNSNSPVENTTANAANTVKAPKKPTLSAKYSRFLSFGYWFLTKTDLNEETRKQLFQQMMMFGTVEEQTVYFEGFFSDIKETNKVMRKMVAEAKKPPKAPKAPRAKKTKAAPAAQDELVAQLIADANGSEVAPSAVAAPTEAAAATVAAKEKKPRAKKVKEVAAEPVADATVAAAAAPKEKKPRAKKVKEVAAEPVADAADATVATEPVTEAAATEPVAEAAPKEKKPRAKKADAAEKPKKTKKSEAAPAVDDASEDVQTRVVTIGDKEYLIDSENNLYDTTFPHDQVGTFNPETGAIQA